MISGGPWHIALVIGELTHGGAERQLYELVRRLDRDRFKPTVICLSEERQPYGPLIEAEKISASYIKNRIHFDPFRVLALRRILQTLKTDLVHSFLHIPNGYVWAATRGLGLPFVASVRAKEENRGLLLRKIDTLVLKSADAVLVNSEHLKVFTYDFYRVPTEKIRVIPNGIDILRFQRMNRTEMRKELGVGQNDLIALTLSKDTPAKNIPLMLRSWSIVTRSLPHAKLVLAGLYLGRSEVEGLAKKMGATGVMGLGEREDAVDLLAVADLFLLSSDREGLPNAIMEAMAAGKPVVATAVGGVSELVVDGETGFLISCGDPPGMAEKICQLAKDPELRRKMGEAGRERIKRQFPVERMVRATEDLYIEMLRRAKKE